MVEDIRRQWLTSGDTTVTKYCHVSARRFTPTEFCKCAAELDCFSYRLAGAARRSTSVQCDAFLIATDQ